METIEPVAALIQSVVDIAKISNSHVRFTWYSDTGWSVGEFGLEGHGETLTEAIKRHLDLSYSVAEKDVQHAIEYLLKAQELQQKIVAAAGC